MTGAAPRWPALLAVAAVALVLRLPGLGTVGEGVDESYSVRATRALLEGRFSYRDLNDFAIDAYQAKFTPVAELVAVPFVALLGDTPVAFRLPSLLASVALVVLLVRAAAARWGSPAGAVAALLTVLDYRALYYAQTHRYVAGTELVVAWLGLRLLDPRPTGRKARAGAVVALGLLAIHGHLLAVLAVGALLVGVARDDLAGPGRRLDRVVPLAALAAWGLGMLLLFRTVAIERFTAAPGLLGSVRSTLRALLGLGPATAVLGLVGAVAAVRSREPAARVLGLAVLTGAAAYLVGGVRLAFQPRYLLVLQPLAVLVAARAVGVKAAAWRAAGRRGARVATVAGLGVLASPGVAACADYLVHRAGRDVERPVHAALVEVGRPGDAVLWDVPRLDPYGFRPRAPRPVPPSHALMDDPAGLDRLVAAGVRYVVRSSVSAPRPLWTPSALARLEVAAPPSSARTSPDPGGPVETVTLYRIR